MKPRYLLILFFIIAFSGKAFSQCFTFTVNACIDGRSILHIQGNQLWWEHLAFSPPGTHGSCGGPVTVNGAVWSPWNAPYTLPNTTTGCSLVANIQSCRNNCYIIQAPSASNNWEGTYDFDDSGPGGAAHYVIQLQYFCPTIDAGPDQTTCAGAGANLNATGGATYSWNPATGLSCTNCANPLATPLNTTTYTVTATDVNGCSATDDVTVNVTPAPVVSFTASPACDGAAVNFTDQSTGNPALWTWDFNDGSPNDNSQNPSHTFPGPGTYTVDLDIAGGGCQASGSMDITVSSNPVADFTVSPANICLGTAAVFTDASTITNPATIVSYDWDFGDGSPHGNIQSPSHTYLAANTYTVVLTVTSNEGCTDTYTTDITVNPIPVADFTFVNQCMGTAVPFTDASAVGAPSVIAGWAWDFDNDLSPDDLTQNPTFNFSAAGNYTVGLGVQSDAGCVSAITHSVTVYANPVANFTAAAVCEGSATTFANTSTGSPNAWTWDFGDASAPDNTQSPTHTYATSGTYNVQLTVTTANGCTDDITTAVDVNPIPVADFSGTDVCRTSPTVFTDNSSVSAPATITDWDWDFQNNGSVDNTTQNPSFTYPTDGPFDVLLTVTSTGGCTDDALVTVTVYSSATADFTFTNVCLNEATDFTDQSTITTGNIVGWAWTFGDGPAVDANQNTTHTYATANIFTVTLAVTSNNGCISTISQDVTVYPLPNADFSATSVCEGVASIFTDMSTVTSGNISTWRYEFGDNSISSSQNPSHPYLTANTYNVELLVTTGQGCLDSITKPVTVYPLPVVDFEAVSDNGCMPLDVQFNDLSTIASGSVVAWNWTIQSAGTATSQDTACTFNNAGQYDVTLSVTSDKGCSASLTRADFVDVHPKPFPAFTFIPQITEILYPEITFTDHSAGGPTQWNWQFGTNDSSQVQHPVYSYPDTGRFTVVLEVFNQYGCSDTVSHTVIITPSFTIYVPNSFTPNDDGVNDIFLPKGIGWRDYELRIFSRSGNEVFSTFDPIIGWNGKVRDAPEFTISDVYVWRIYVRDKNNRMQDFKGTVTLVR